MISATNFYKDRLLAIVRNDKLFEEFKICTQIDPRVINIENNVAYHASKPKNTESSITIPQNVERKC